MVLSNNKNKWKSQQIHKKHNNKHRDSKHYGKAKRKRKHRKKFKSQRRRTKIHKQMAFDYQDFIYINKYENSKRIQIATSVKIETTSYNIASVYNSYYQPEYDQYKLNNKLSTHTIHTNKITKSKWRTCKKNNGISFYDDKSKGKRHRIYSDLIQDITSYIPSYIYYKRNNNNRNGFCNIGEYSKSDWNIITLFTKTKKRRQKKKSQQRANKSPPKLVKKIKIRNISTNKKRCWCGCKATKPYKYNRKMFIQSGMCFSRFKSMMKQIRRNSDGFMQGIKRYWYDSISVSVQYYALVDDRAQYKLNNWKFGNFRINDFKFACSKCTYVQSMCHIKCELCSTLRPTPMINAAVKITCCNGEKLITVMHPMLFDVPDFDSHINEIRNITFPNWWGRSVKSKLTQRYAINAVNAYYNLAQNNDILYSFEYFREFCKKKKKMFSFKYFTQMEDRDNIDLEIVFEKNIPCLWFSFDIIFEYIGYKKLKCLGGYTGGMW